MRLLLLLVLFASLVSCITPSPPKQGCTDRNSLTFDFEAEEDDGNCEYSKVAFYAKYNSFNGIPIRQIDVSVNGNNLGSVTTSYLNGPPGNCSALGTIPYSFQKGLPIEWNTVVHLVNGATLVGSGTVSPSGTQECIKVNVTN